MRDISFELDAENLKGYTNTRSILRIYPFLDSPGQSLYIFVYQNIAIKFSLKDVNNFRLEKVIPLEEGSERMNDDSFNFYVDEKTSNIYYFATIIHEIGGSSLIRCDACTVFNQEGKVLKKTRIKKPYNVADYAIMDAHTPERVSGNLLLLVFTFSSSRVHVHTFNTDTMEIQVIHESMALINFEDFFKMITCMVKANTVGSAVVKLHFLRSLYAQSNHSIRLLSPKFAYFSYMQQNKAEVKSFEVEGVPFVKTTGYAGTKAGYRTYTLTREGFRLVHMMEKECGG